MSGIKTTDIVNLVKNERYIKDTIAKNNISDEEITEYLSVFEDAFQSLNLCKKCPGLENCPQKVKGHVYTVGYSGRPVNVIRYCKYLDYKRLLEELKEHYVYTDIPNALLSVNLDNLNCRNEWQELLFKPLDDIARKERKKGLYIYGSFGVGKTYFVSALANTLVADGNKVVFVKCNSFVTDMSSLLVRDSYAYETLLNKIKNADYVIFDDIGTENVTSFSRDRLLYNILDYRMENKLCTIFTSNLNIDSLEKHFDQLPENNASRMCERIKTLADEIILKGENQRHND